MAPVVAGMKSSRFSGNGAFWPAVGGSAILAILYLASVSGYLLFHSLAEIFAIAISGAVFTLGLEQP